MTSPRVTLVCEECGKKARRKLAVDASSRGVHEAPCEPAMCPSGHGAMVRVDGRTVSEEVAPIERDPEGRSHAVGGYRAPHDRASFDARQRLHPNDPERRRPCRPCTFKVKGRSVTVWDD